MEEAITLFVISLLAFKAVHTQTNITSSLCVTHRDVRAAMMTGGNFNF